MSNEVLFFLVLLLNFSFIVLVYRFCGKVGLYVWVPVSIIIANIQVLKTISLFGLSATLGGVLYAGSFLITDILSEVYGRESARPAIYFGFIAQIAITLFMNIAIAFVPSATDIAQAPLEAIFSFFPAITIASLLAFAASQYHDIWAFELWKRFRPAPQFLWLRNNMSTIVSQIIDSLIFILACVLFGVFPASEFGALFASTYLIKLIAALADTPFVYAAQWLKRKNWVVEL